MTDEPTLEEQLAASYALYKAGEPGVPWEQMRVEARLVRAEAERDAALAVLRQIVAGKDGWTEARDAWNAHPCGNCERDADAAAEAYDAAWDAARRLLAEGEK